MMRKRVVAPKGTRYYDTDYPNQFPIGNYFANHYGLFPSFADADKRYELEVADYFKNNKTYIRTWEHMTMLHNSTGILSEIYENQETGTLVYIKYKSESKRSNPYGLPDELISVPGDDDTSRNPDYAVLSFYYVDSEFVKGIAKEIRKYIVIKKSKSKISLVTSARHGLDIIEQDIEPVDIDLSLNYGSSFLPVHKKIVDKLNDDYGKGLVLLHGMPGTGKTNYIRYLCGQINKEIIFLPPFLAENIASPDFITFLLEHRNSILVIEDAEKVVLDRENDTSNRQSVANLLNMTDGLLSDCLSIQIIATFNTNRELIDKALLRKGRLIAEWKFDKLPVESANNLLKHLGKEEITNVPMALTEIYNVDEEEFVVKQQKTQIGFSR